MSYGVRGEVGKGCCVHHKVVVESIYKESSTFNRCSAGLWCIKFDSIKEYTKTAR